MGSMIDIYTQSQLDQLTPRTLYETIRNSIHFDECQRLAEDSQTVTVKLKSCNKMLALKGLLEYKYFMPIHYRWKYRELVFHGYSAHKLLKIIEDHHRFYRKKREQFETVIESTADDKISVYAAGAIEHAKDKGVGYRQKLKEQLEYTHVKIVDPCDFIYNGGEQTLNEHAAENDLFNSYWHTQPVVDGDCGAVIETEAVIAYIDPAMLQGTGTKAEMTVARAVKRPVYGVVSPEVDLKDDVSAWTRACVSRYFPSFEELREFVVRSE